MSRTIHIEPITRIEGHAKISIQLDDQGRVADARFHVTEFRGFEKFCIGRSFWEMPGITARVCGICPVSHLLASSKAGDAILGVRTPAPAIALRRLMNYAQLVQSHALSFFLLSGPDLLLGMDSNPEQRNLTGLIAAHPEVARAGIRLRAFGQHLIRTLGERSVHPSWSVPGGVRAGLEPQAKHEIRAQLPEMFAVVDIALDLFKDALDRVKGEIDAYGDFPSLFMGLVGEDGSLEHYDGRLRIVDADGKIIEDQVAPENFAQLITEGEETWSYLKFPYYAPLGPEKGMYRVGPLARLNVCDFAGTRKADRELRQFRHYCGPGRPVSSSFFYHYARLIEILHSLERIEEILDNDILAERHIRSRAGVNQNVGVGVCEAPRGTLFHHYQVDDNGLLEKVNLIIATGQNNLAMNRTIKQIAQRFLSADRLDEGLLNRVEHGIRAYDPCLSCSTHEAGRMPLQVELRDVDGRLLDEVRRA
ncbi:NAD(P)-dependent nickel-iron dehydrogenase catalytic subunit [Geoalkalibacter ferrihydriticus]|uniref:NADP oxidoreductase n=2 Tax=Geoalkalibacter ferrihydriticus TaxID=392333 RepID=A0A0C2HPI6_9BACT|nr:Ni/Fe hydrogenase subunit alpha [Geoalkalibacter ferrihydriticus]KIH76855.1 NADP oxidoreductase [Geoalkalibacter ferrihydriticus DSM 17813]SDL47577.1 NAD(P)-dependent nickel-iron dehydrogenase catalytic subunit [Geoalkalibacter ferrihydriticus]